MFNVLTPIHTQTRTISTQPPRDLFGMTGIAKNWGDCYGEATCMAVRHLPPNLPNALNTKSDEMTDTSSGKICFEFLSLPKTIPVTRNKANVKCLPSIWHFCVADRMCLSGEKAAWKYLVASADASPQRGKLKKTINSSFFSDFTTLWSPANVKLPLLKDVELSERY